MERCDVLSTTGFQYSFWEYVLVLKLVRILKVAFINTELMIRSGTGISVTCFLHYRPLLLNSLVL